MIYTNPTMNLMLHPLLESFPIQTKQLSINVLTEKDLPFLQKLLSDEQVMRFSFSGPMNPNQVAERLLVIQQGYASDGHHFFGIYSTEYEPRFLGIVGLIWQTVDDERLLELAYRLLPSEWGQGFATAAAKTLAKWAFAHLEIDRLISLIEPENIASRRVAERVGMHLFKRSVCFSVPCDVFCIQRVELITVDESWKKTIQEQISDISEIDVECDFTLYPMGSTAITGILAQPIIDILGTVSDITMVDRHQGEFEKLGFRALGEKGLPHRRYFTRPTPHPMHLQIFEDTDPEVGRSLRFVEYLKNDQETADAYSELKKKIGKKFCGDPIGYVKQKHPFVHKVNTLAAKTASPHTLYTKGRKERWTNAEENKALHVNKLVFQSFLGNSIEPIERLVLHDALALRSTAPMYNCILESSLAPATIPKRIRKITSLYKEGTSLCWWVAERDCEQLGSQLEKAGWRATEQYVGLISDGQAVFSSPPSDPWTATAVTEENMKQWCQQRWGKERAEELFTSLFSHIPDALQTPPEALQSFLLTSPGLTGGIGSLFCHAGVAGIYDVHSDDDEALESIIEHLMWRGQKMGFHRFITVVRADESASYRQLKFQPRLSWISYQKIWK